MVILYSMDFIWCDTQLILGTKRHGLSKDDYIIGAIVIYIDIVILFMRLVKLLRMMKKR